MGSKVYVYIYDLSRGMARALSRSLLGKQIDGIWHTGIVAYGEEYFFGGSGIESCHPGGTLLGQPNQVEELGVTEIPYELFYEHLRELSASTFRACDYHLLNRNCNNFSSEVAQFLTGNDIPSYITGLPSEVLSTPFGQMIKPMIESMNVNPGEGVHPLFGDAPPSQRIVTPSSSYQKLKATTSSRSSNSAAVTAPAAAVAQATPAKKTSMEAVVYTPKEIITSDQLSSTLSQADSRLISELLEYAYIEDCDWGIGPAHLKKFVEILSSTQTAVDRKLFWQVLQRLLLKTDTFVIMKRVQCQPLYHSISVEEQEAIKALCNLCANEAGYKIVLAECKALLNELCNDIANLRSDSHEVLEVVLSTAHNVSIHHSLTDDLDVPYVSAIVELLHSNSSLIGPPSVQLALKALLNFMSKNEQVVDLVKVMGLDLSPYRDLVSGSGDELAKVFRKLEEFNL